MKQLYPIVNNMENLWYVILLLMLGLVVIYGTRSLKEPWVPLRFRGTKHKVQSTKLKVPTAEGTYFPKVHHFETKLLLSWTSSGGVVYMIPVRGSLPPPPPPHGMVPKPAFCSIPHENVVFAVFFAWWVAGAVRNPANSLDFCNQPSENVLFAMFRLRHRGVVPPRPLLFLCQIII